MRKETYTCGKRLHPLTEEIRLETFVSRDLTIFSLNLLSDGDSVYTRENLYENLGTPVKPCLYVWGTKIKLVGNFGSCSYFKSDLLCL